MTDHADDEIKSLYIRFYCDEDVSVDIAHNLQQRGFDVLIPIRYGETAFTAATK